MDTQPQAHETSNWNAQDLMGKKIVYQQDALDRVAAVAKRTKNTVDIQEWIGGEKRLLSDCFALCRNNKEEAEMVFNQLEAAELSTYAPGFKGNTSRKVALIMEMDRWHLSIVRLIEGTNYLFSFSREKKANEVLHDYVNRFKTKEQIRDKPRKD